MVRTSLAWRISGAYLALILAVLLGLVLYIASFTRAAYFDQLEAQLAADAAVAAGEAAALLGGPAGAEAALQALAARIGTHGGAGVTLIALDGRVLGDSAESPSAMDNHAGRPEVAAALRGQRGVSVRHSETVGYDMLYVAAPIVANGQISGAARAALPLRAIDRTAATLVGAVILAVAVTGLAATILAVWLGRTISGPIKRLTVLAGEMAGGRLNSRLAVGSRDEIGELGQAFNRMADRLEETFDTISTERNRLAAILETVADGLVIVDPSGRVVTLNPGAERLLQTSEERAVGRPFIAVARDHELAELLDRPERGGRLIELGRPRRQVRAVAATIPGTGGQRLLLLQDVTELRRLESVRRDFVANVSHELRTPIAAIKAIAETLEDGALDDPPAARTFLSQLHGEVDRLTQMVRELLELSRIESGQATVTPRPVDLATLLRSAADRFRPLASRSGLELRLTIPPDLPPTVADPDRIDQVLANLLHNAVKFTPPGGWIELCASRRGQESGVGGQGGSQRIGVGDADSTPTLDSRLLAPDEVVISVADGGIGIPPDDLDRIFERFFKTDRSRSGGGTGLGLAIAKHLVQAHGGRIWAESSGSRGTTFSFTLPTAGESSLVPGLSSLEGSAPSREAGRATRDRERETV